MYIIADNHNIYQTYWQVFFMFKIVGEQSLNRYEKTLPHGTQRNVSFPATICSSLDGRSHI